MSLLDVLNICADGTLLAIAVALPTSTDLLALSLTCSVAAQRLYLTSPRWGNEGSGGGEPRKTSGGTQTARAETWSIVQEAARRWLLTTCNDQERGWVPCRRLENQLDLMREVELLRRPLVFGRSHAAIMLWDGGSRALKEAQYASVTWRAAASSVEMRAGRHYAQFTILQQSYYLFGVIRPDWDVEGGACAYRVSGHCFYSSGYGSGSHSSNGQPASNGHEWEGQQCAKEVGDRIGLLLDLDEGSMTVYKNDQRLGVMARGLSGPYCWAVELLTPHSCTCIEHAKLPIQQ